MLNLLLTSLLVLSPQEGQDVPDPALVKETVADLKATFKSGDAESIVVALEAAAAVPSAEVAREVGKGLRKKDQKVIEASIQALRWMDHPEALKILTSTWKKDKAVKKSEVLSAAVLKAIGQHGDPSSIKVLSDKPFDTPYFQSIRARLLGLGNIRTKESVEALMDMTTKVGNLRVDRYMSDIRLSLLVLTGTDQGNDPEQWRRWWRSNGKDLEVSPELPEMPRMMLLKWNEYWGIEDELPRRERREDRGDEAPGSEG